MIKNRLQEIIAFTKNLKVLYIEDNVDVREQTLKMLNIFFHNIIVGSNGDEGLIIFKANNNYENKNFDLIITDIEMPVIDGISMINSIRQINRHIPILVFSAHSNPDYMLQTINAGIDGYLLKPYNIEQISNTLMNVIEKNKLTKINDNRVNLDFDFSWDSDNSILYKNGEVVKLTKNEIMLFKLFINSKGLLKTYDEIENFIFDGNSSNNKRVRNLVSRLKTKLNHELFEAIYSHGYKLRYKRFD
ncbi:MAG: response regulator transcription factor [Halarcobacter sp.]